MVPSTKDWKVRSIIGEDDARYYIDWEPDEETGEVYDPAWEPKKYVNSRAVKDWQSKKAASSTGPKSAAGRVSAAPAHRGSRPSTMAEASPPKHWLHKSPTELLNAARRHSPRLEILRSRIFIKHLQTVFVVLGPDGDSYGPPTHSVMRGSTESSKPLSEFVLARLAATSSSATTNRVVLQLMEFGFANPITTSIADQLSIAVIVSPEPVQSGWTPEGFGIAGSWSSIDGDAWEGVFADRVQHRMLGMSKRKVIATQSDTDRVSLELLRSIGGCIRYSELSGSEKQESIVILGPTDIDKYLYPQEGIYLTTVSAPWMAQIRSSTKAMDVDHREGGPTFAHRTFRVIGWIDRRKHVERVAFADTPLSLGHAFNPDGSIRQRWIPSRIGTWPGEFFLKTSDDQPVMRFWDVNTIMGI